jgi:uncharacterized membrane protein
MDGLCIAVLWVLVLFSWLPRYRGPIDLRWDGGVYYVLGTSLADGKGYRLLNEPGEIEAIQYPPGLPALVAIHEMILGSNDPAIVGVWMRRSWLLMSLLYISSVFLLSRIFLPRSYAMLLALTCLLNYQMCFLSTLCFAELPFALTSTLFGYLYFRQKQGFISRIGAGSAAVASYLLRTIGVALLIAWVLDAALRKEYRKASVRAAIAIVPIVLWHSYIHSAESAEHYERPYYAYQRAPSMFYNVSYATNVALKSPFEPEKGWATTRDLLNRFAHNLGTMSSTLGEAVSANEDPFWDGSLMKINRLIKPLALPGWSSKCIVILLALTVIGGIGSMLWRRQWLIAIYLSVTIAGICTTAWPGQFVRYLVPAEPFLLLASFGCLIEVSRLARLKFPSSRFGFAIPLAIILLAVAGSAVSWISGNRNFSTRTVYEDDKGIAREYRLYYYGGASLASQAGLKWLVAHADRRAIVAVSMPQWVYLKTGLKTVMPPLDLDPQKAQQLIDTVPATYVILDKLAMESYFNKRFSGLVVHSPDKWRLVFESPRGNFDIFQRIGLNPPGAIEPVQLPPRKSLRF